MSSKVVQFQSGTFLKTDKTDEDSAIPRGHAV